MGTQDQEKRRVDIGKASAFAVVGVFLVFMLAIIGNTVRGSHTNYAPPPSVEFSTPGECLAQLPGRCLFYEADEGSYEDFSGSLSFSDGEMTRPDRLYYTYHLSGTAPEEVVEEYRFEVRLSTPELDDRLITGGALEVKRGTSRGVDYVYALESVSEHGPSAQTQVREGLAFAFGGDCYIIETTLLENDRGAVWSIFDDLTAQISAQ